MGRLEVRTSSSHPPMCCPNSHPCSQPATHTPILGSAGTLSCYSLLCVSCRAWFIAGLDALAGAAAQAARAKRKQGLKAGRDVCWRAGCACQTNLVGVAKERVPDAMHYMLYVEGADLGTFGGKPRTLPTDQSYNRQCPQHAPKLTAFRIIGADVAVEVDGGILLGAVDRPIYRGSSQFSITVKC